MPLLAVLGSKGGAGKTSLATNVAALAARDTGHATLVDLDPNAGATEALLDGPAPGTLDEDLRWRRPLAAVPVRTVPGLELAPGGVSPDWDAEAGTADALAAALQGRKGWVVLDTPPSWGSLVGAALRVATVAILVVDCSGRLGRAGVADQLDVIQAVRQHRRGLRFAGIVPNKVGRTRSSRNAYQVLADTYRHVLPPVRLAAPVAAAVDRQATVLQMPQHPVLDDLEAVWRGIRG